MPITTPNYYSVANPTFQRAMRNILNISQSNPVLITTTYNGLAPADHNYNSGLIARINIPLNFGMQQLNQFEGVVTVINSTQFTMPIDTTTFDPYIVPLYGPGHNGTPASVVPIGEINDILTEATQNVLLPI